MIIGDQQISVESIAPSPTKDFDTIRDGMNKENRLYDSLPREILTQSILIPYLDGKSLVNFWCATMSKREMLARRGSPRKQRRRENSPLSMVEEIIQIVQQRKDTIVDDDSCTLDYNNNNERNIDAYGSQLRRKVFQIFEEAANTGKNSEPDSDQKETSQGISSFSLTAFLRLSRKMFASLSAIDYCEVVPSNMIWCGFLRIRNRNKPEPLVRVMLLVHPQRWSGKEIRLWRNSTKQSNEVLHDTTPERVCSIMETEVLPHNFLPVGPKRGRLVGVSESDRRSLQKLSLNLDQNGLVARFSCMTSSRGLMGPMNKIDSESDPRDRAGQFTVKLMAFEQAQLSLDAVFRNRSRERGGIPLYQEKEKMILDRSIGMKHGRDENWYSEVNDDNKSLLCCWNHEFLWEDSRSFQLETSKSLQDTISSYRKMITLS